MNNISQTWGPIRTILRSKCAASLVRKIIGPTGIEMDKLPFISGTPSTIDYDNFMQALDKIFYSMGNAKRKNFLQIIIEELLNYKPDLRDSLEKNLTRLGWTIHENNIIPIEIFDPSELSELPKDAEPDLIKAAMRLRDGDLSGAISAACGAVDTITKKIYIEKGLGDHNNTSFQERIAKSLEAYQVFQKTEKDLNELGWEKEDAKKLQKNYNASINQAAYVMQTLRSKMGDVHGTKPSLRPLTFDCLKWSSIILKLLKF